MFDYYASSSKSDAADKEHARHGKPSLLSKDRCKFKTLDCGSIGNFNLTAMRTPLRKKPQESKAKRQNCDEKKTDSKWSGHQVVTKETAPNKSGLQSDEFLKKIVKIRGCLF